MKIEITSKVYCVVTVNRHGSVNVTGVYNNQEDADSEARVQDNCGLDATVCQSEVRLSAKLLKGEVT